MLTFYLFAAVIVGSALMMVTRRNAITAAVFLTLSLLAVAGLYITLGAEFLFAVQVLVYTGGIMVLFLFVIMLVNVDDLAHVRMSIRRWWLPVTFAAVAFGGLVMAATAGELGASAVPEPLDLGSNTKEVALILFARYLLPFEAISILLLVAMIGAILLAKKEL